MGEKIRNIGEFKLGNQNILIELNEGYSKDYSTYDIHIQSKHIQYCLSNSEFMQLATCMINAREKFNALKSYDNNAKTNCKYVIFGAGNYGKQAVELIGRDNISFFIDNDSVKQESGYLGFEVMSLDRALKTLESFIIVIAVDESLRCEIEMQLSDYGICNYKLLNSVICEITRKKIQSEINHKNIFNKAIHWIERYSVPNKGIITATTVKLPYPEVSGYYIPTLIRFGYQDLAIEYAKWLCSIQHDSGAWYDSQNKHPYIFDSAQILKGLIAVRELYAEVDEHIKRGCNWILSNMNNEGRLISPLENAWGDGKIFSELIHTYCISPIKEAGKIFGISQYIEKADKIIHYYTTECRDDILNFNLLSHFYAYVIEAMLDIGKEELAREAMDKIALLQKPSGAVPAYSDVDWVCSTGMFQLALIWFRLGEIERGNKAFEYACKLQNESGGWYGSYLSEDNPKEKNNYFPNGEISWAVKYFLDALYYKNLTENESENI